MLKSDIVFSVTGPNLLVGFDDIPMTGGSTNTTTDMSDRELVEAALADPPRNFGPIIEHYKNAVFGVSLARDLPPVMYPLAELGCQGGGSTLASSGVAKISSLSSSSLSFPLKLST